MKIELEIKDEDIISVLIGALEGGSNYWYLLDDLSMLQHSQNTYLEDEIYYTVMNGIEIPVYDIENPKDLLGYISSSNIIRGIQMYYDINNILNFDEMDADDYDELFQYIVLGELIYG